MKFVAVLFGLFVMIVGLIGIAAPSALLRAADYATTPVGLYVAAAVRIGIGVVLIAVASASRAPRLLRGFGAIAIAAGVLTAVIGIDRARAVLAWEIGQGTILVRLGAALALVFGAFIVFAVSGGFFFTRRRVGGE